MKNFKLSALTSEERKSLLRPGLLLCLLTTGLAIGRSANDTFFIGASGASQLPKVYMFNALVLAIVSLCYSFLEKRIARFSFLSWILILATLLLLYLRRQLFQGDWWLPYAIFCYYEVLLLLIQMHFWTCVNDIFGPREGKRIFPYLGAIGLVGSIAGGGFTWFAAPHIGYHNLFFVWIALLACAVPLSISLKVSAAAGSDSHAGHSSPRQREFQNFLGLWKVPLVRYMALISIPLWLVVHTLDWLFYLALEESFMGQADQLSAFLGFVSGAISFLGILLQFFISPYVLSKWGVSFAYSFYSISMSVGAFLFHIRNLLPFGGIWSQLRLALPVAVRFLDEAVFFSIYDSAIQLLYGALPASMRGQARAFIYGILETVMTALTGGLLLLAVEFEIAQIDISVICICLSLLWVYLSLGIKKHYLHALALNLNSHDIEHHNQALKVLKNSRIKAKERALLLESICSHDQDVALLSLRYIQKLGDHESYVALAKCIPQIRGAVFEMALGLLSQNKISEVLPILKRIYLSNVPEQRALALRCIASMEPAFIQDNINYFMCSDEPAIKGAAILSLIESKKRLSPQSPALKGLAQMALSSNSGVQREALRVIGEAKTKRLTPILLQIAKKAKHEMKEDVFRSMSYIRDSQIVRFLTEELQETENANLINRALIYQGESALPALHKHIRSRAKDMQQSSLPALENMIFCLGEIAHIKSIQVLGKLLSSHVDYLESSLSAAMAHIARRNFQDTKSRIKEKLSLRLQNKIEKRFYVHINNMEKMNNMITELHMIHQPYIREILFDAILRCFRYSQEQALKYLELQYNPSEIHAARHGLKRKEERIQSETMEILEGLGEHGSELCRIIENSAVHLQAGAKSLSENTQSNGYAAGSLPAQAKEALAAAEEGEAKHAKKREKAVETLIKELAKIQSDPWFSACILYSIGELGLKGLSSVVQKFYKHPDSMLEVSALDCAKKLGLPAAKSSKKPQSLMNAGIERILFLRSIPLFTDVDSKDLQWISQIVIEQEFARNQYIFRENETGDTFYIVQEGEIHIRKGNITLNILQPKDYFGEIAIFDNEARSASALAKQTSLLLSIRRNDFQSLLLARPRISLAMFGTISRRLRDLTQKLAT